LANEHGWPLIHMACITTANRHALGQSRRRFAVVIHRMWINDTPFNAKRPA